MLLGYNTNGFAHHRLEDAIRILADLGYQSIAITLDYHALNPYGADCDRELGCTSRLLHRLGLSCVIETGARFLLDPYQKHQPTLLSSDPARRKQRLDFLRQAVQMAAQLPAAAVSFWSGAPEGEEPADVLMDRLVDGCAHLREYAARSKVRLAFEPEPGMMIDTMPRFAELYQRVGPEFFGLTLDIGHLHCQGESLTDPITTYRDALWNVHIEDMRRGVHDHLMFGEGEIDFIPVMRALNQIDYQGGVHVELSRHSYDAVNTARRAMGFLRGLAR